MKRILPALALLATLLARPSQGQPVCVSFGPPPPVNTTYGAPVGQSLVVASARAAPFRRSSNEENRTGSPRSSAAT